MIDSNTTKTTAQDLKQMNRILKSIPFTRLNILLKVIIESADNEIDFKVDEADNSSDQIELRR